VTSRDRATSLHSTCIKTYQIQRARRVENSSPVFHE